MSAAAGAVGLSQPALTQGLAKLEARLGTTLFERRPDGMIATAHGLLVADRAEAAFDHLALGARTGSRGFARPERLMTAAQLRSFLALADFGSFVSAAEAIGLSQPALHRSVGDLEQIVGVALVERRGRGVALTAAGRRMARGIRLAAGEIAAAIAETRPGEGSGRIAIGAMPLSRATLVPQAAARLVAARPAASLTIVEGSWRELVELLRDGVIDLMIGALRPHGAPDLDQTPLHDDRPVVVAGPRHPLAGRTEVTREELRGYDWIVGPDNSPLRSLWEALFAGGPLPRRPIECGSVMVLRSLLTAGDFLTLLSPDQVALEIASGILVHVGKPLRDHARTIGVTTRIDWRPTAVQRDLVGHLRAVAVDIASQEIE